VREFATSKDGTKVPVNILRRKGTKLDGKNPTLLTGYGGYGVNLAPRYQPTVRLWLEQGGVFAEANLRGGGEYGEAWHQGGMLTRKQHVFDDFIACAEHLVARGYTRPSRLAIRGGSNGGLLMGAVLTQRPDLAAVVVARVGIFDMLRVERDPNGAFNVTEFGTVADPAQFEALHAYSPYHRVKDGAAYPAVLFTTGVHDPRVLPYHPFKMAARLQAASSSGKPVLLRVNQSGHGLSASLDERVDEEADVHAFLFEQLGMKPRKPAARAAPARAAGG
jgi:prolyl oligopeptidase